MLLLPLRMQQQENWKFNMLPLRSYKSWSLNNWSSNIRLSSLVDFSLILFDLEWPCRLVVSSCKSCVTYSIILSSIILGSLVRKRLSELKSKIISSMHSYNNFNFTICSMDYHLLRLDLQRKHSLLRMGSTWKRIS